MADYRITGSIEKFQAGFEVYKGDDDEPHWQIHINFQSMGRKSRYELYESEDSEPQKGQVLVPDVSEGSYKNAVAKILQINVTDVAWEIQ